MARKHSALGAPDAAVTEATLAAIGIPTPHREREALSEWCWWTSLTGRLADGVSPSG